MMCLISTKCVPQILKFVQFKATYLFKAQLCLTTISYDEHTWQWGGSHQVCVHVCFGCVCMCVVSVCACVLWVCVHVCCGCVSVCCVVSVYSSVCDWKSRQNKIRWVSPSELRFIVPIFGIQSTNLFITHQGIIYWQLWLNGQRRHLQQILMDKTATLIAAFRWIGAGRTDWQTDFSFHYLSRV